MVRAGVAEAKILESRRPIPRIVRDTTAPAELRAKLRLVQDARDYAERALDLDPAETFRSYAETGRDTLLLVVSAAPRFGLEWKTWWYPVVGSLPYRGYFNFERAREEARRLERRGFDTWVRPTAAFSTLGWLPDPVLTPVVRSDSVSVVETVIHEITHTTYFPKGHANFNESFANFVGHVGAIQFFCRALEDAGACRRARDRWADTRTFGAFLTDLHDRLSELYGRRLPDGEMAERKTAILREAARRYARDIAPGYRSGPGRPLDPDRLNNAWLLSRVLYYRRLEDFHRVRQRTADAREAIRSVIEAARAAPDPWTGLDRLLGAVDGDSVEAGAGL